MPRGALALCNLWRITYANAPTVLPSLRLAKNFLKTLAKSEGWKRGVGLRHGNRERGAKVSLIGFLFPFAAR